MVRLWPTIHIKGGIFYETNRKTNINIIVARVNKIGDIANARPCYNCLQMMKAVGIKKVYYTISNVELVCENVNNMVSIHVSATTRVLTMDKNINTSQYFKKILVNFFPNVIRKQNLDLFLKYNFINVLPKYKIHINKSIIYIMDENNICVKNARVV